MTRGRAWGLLAVVAPLAAGCIPQGYDRAPERPVYRPPPYDDPRDRADRSQPPERYDDRDSQAQAEPPYRPERADAEAVRAPRTAPPAWAARPVAPDARDVAQGSYTVAPGDTLRAIGERTGAGSEAIARANALPPPFMVRTGQRLLIPAGRYHLVHAGETGIAIARAYGIDWSRIVTANALVEPYTLRVGMRVLIPIAASGPTSIAERAAAFRLDVDDLVTGSEPALAVNERPARAVATSTRVLPSTAAITEPIRLRGNFAWPLTGRIVARFGPGASGERNNGIKIAVPVDTPILAAADGVVAYAGDEIASLGGLIIIKHGGGWTTVYGHASRLLVQRGQSVKRGEVIARSGDTGFADRPELHFEMRKGRTPVDPQGQLPQL